MFRGGWRGRAAAPAASAAEVRRHVARRANQPLLLTRPEPDADRAAQLHAADLQDAHRLEHRRRSRGVVGGARGGVPRVEVRAEHHDLIGLVGAANLAHHVEHRRHRRVGGLDVGLDDDRHALRHHAIDAAVLFRGDRNRRQHRRRIAVPGGAADRVDAMAIRGRGERAEGTFGLEVCGTVERVTGSACAAAAIATASGCCRVGIRRSRGRRSRQPCVFRLAPFRIGRLAGADIFPDNRLRWCSRRRRRRCRRSCGRRRTSGPARGCSRGRRRARRLISATTASACGRVGIGRRRILHAIELFGRVPRRRRVEVRVHVRRGRGDHPLAFQVARLVFRLQRFFRGFRHQDHFTANEPVRAGAPCRRRAANRKRLRQRRCKIELVVRPAARETAVLAAWIDRPRLQGGAGEAPFLHPLHRPVAGLLDVG